LRISEILSRRGPILNAFSRNFERFTSKGLTDKSRANFVQAAIVFGPENARRRICELKGIDLDSDGAPK
jgi:hypothetical protein